MNDRADQMSTALIAEVWNLYAHSNASISYIASLMRISRRQVNFAIDEARRRQRARPELRIVG